MYIFTTVLTIFKKTDSFNQLYIVCNFYTIFKFIQLILHFAFKFNSYRRYKKKTQTEVLTKYLIFIILKVKLKLLFLFFKEQNMYSLSSIYVVEHSRWS